MPLCMWYNGRLLGNPQKLFPETDSGQRVIHDTRHIKMTPRLEIHITYGYRLHPPKHVS